MVYFHFLELIIIPEFVTELPETEEFGPDPIENSPKEFTCVAAGEDKAAFTFAWFIGKFSINNFLMLILSQKFRFCRICTEFADFCSVTCNYARSKLAKKFKRFKDYYEMEWANFWE